MFRILDGVLHEGKTVDSAWVVSVWERGGHREVSARRPVVWHEVGPVNERDALGYLLEPEPLTAAELAKQEEEKRQRNLLRSARRAKTKCRRLIKAHGFDELLTLTYRQNQTDRALAQRHFKEWVRRVRRVIPDFEYVAAPERQKRGAWHFHVCTWKLPKTVNYGGATIKAWRLGTAIWRSVVGEDNGLCYVGGRDRFGRPLRFVSVAKMAAYVSKYITKDYGSEVAEKNRYSASAGLDAGRPTSFMWTAGDVDNTRQVIELMVDVGESEQVVDLSMTKLGDRIWFCIEPKPKRLPGRQS